MAGTHLGGEAGIAEQWSLVGSEEQADMDWTLLCVSFVHHCDFLELCENTAVCARSLPRLECALTIKYTSYSVILKRGMLVWKLCV